MTDKKKRRAKALSKASGMSHEAAMNVLNKNQKGIEVILPEGLVDTYVLRPTDPNQASELDRELGEILGPVSEQQFSSEEIQDAMDFSINYHPDEVTVLKMGATYDRVGEDLKGYRGSNNDPTLSINKLPEPKLVLKNPKQFQKPKTVPSKNIVPPSPVQGYRKYYWLDLKELKAIQKKKIPAIESYNVASVPAVTVASLAFSMSPSNKNTDEVIFVLTNTDLDDNGETPVVVLRIPMEFVRLLCTSRPVPPEWLKKFTEPSEKYIQDVPVSDERNNLLKAVLAEIRKETDPSKLRILVDKLEELTDQMGHYQPPSGSV